MPPATRLDLVAENAELRARLAEAEDMLRAIRRGEIDALVTQSDTGARAYKRAEEELRHSERLHRIAFDLAPIGLVYIALDARFINVNARMCDITGYAADELLRMTVNDLTHPDDRTHDNELLRPFLSGSAPSYANEKRYVRKDGSSRWVAVTARMVTDDAGQPLHTVGAIRDIQERKTADAALHTSEIRYRRLFEAAHDGVLILDPATRKIVDANPFMTTLLGYPHGQLIGLELYEIGFLADAQASRDMFQTLTTTRQVRYENLPLQSQGGGLRNVEVVANLYDEDGRTVVQCNVRDITERRRTETELRERQHFLNRIFEVLPGVLYVFDLDENRVVFVNNTAEGTFSSEEIAGMGADVVPNLMHPDDHQGFQEHIARIRTLDPGATATFEYRMRDKAGEWRWYMGTDTVFLRDESGVARQLIGIAPEITDRKRAEFALRESEARSQRDADEIASIYATAPIGLCVLDRGLRYQRINSQLASINGIPAEAHIGKTVREIVPDVADECERIAAQVFATGEPVIGIEVSGMTEAKPGKLRHWMSQWVPIEDASGAVTGISIVAEEITERKDAEAALEASERRNRTLIDATSAVTWSCAPSGLLVEPQPQWTAFTGQSTSEMLGGGHVTAFHPDDAENAWARWADAVARDAPYHNELRIRRHDGEWCWMRVHSVPVHRDGVAVEWFGMCIDITERKQAQAVLRESEALQAFLLKLSDALRAEPSAEAMTDRALRMLFGQLRLNRCYVGIYRLAEDTGQFPHQVHDDRLPPFPAQLRLSDFPEALRVAFDRTLVIDNVGKMEGLSDSERANFAGLGVGALIAATLHKGENNPLWAIVAVSTSPRVWTPGEVSLVEEVAERTWAAVERAQAEERLQVAHDTFRNLVERSPFGTYIIDADFRLIQISDGGQKAFANVRPLIGRDFTEVVRAIWPDPFASEVIARFRHTLATGEPFKAETNERRADIEATETYDWKIERVILPDGRFGVVCHFYDLSERKRHEEHIQLLLREVNHRSKNMLGLVQAVARQTAKTSPDDFVTSFGERIQALAAAQDLIVSSDWKAVSLSELIRSQLAHFQDLIGNRIQLHGPDIMVWPAAAQAIGMALHEMATNAVKYGALSNKIGRLEVTWNMLAGPCGGPQFAMSWTESGGPPVTKPPRRGFGSTVIGVMVNRSLDCDAEIDHAPTGFRWRIACPAAKIIENAEAATIQRSVTTPANGSKRVLVVEDEPLIAMEIAAILSDAGFTVIGPVGSVAHALALIERSGCEAAVLDINLGKETAEPIARVLSARATPFVTISGYSREQQPAAFRNAPLVSKPVRPELLIAEIRKCLSETF